MIDAAGLTKRLGCTAGTTSGRRPAECARGDEARADRSRTTGVSRVARGGEWRTPRAAAALVTASPPARAQRVLSLKRAARQQHSSANLFRRGCGIGAQSLSSEGAPRGGGRVARTVCYDITVKHRATRYSYECMCFAALVLGAGGTHRLAPLFGLPRRVGDCSYLHRRRVRREKPQPGSNTVGGKVPGDVRVAVSFLLFGVHIVGRRRRDPDVGRRASVASVLRGRGRTPRRVVPKSTLAHAVVRGVVDARVVAETPKVEDAA